MNAGQALVECSVDDGRGRWKVSADLTPVDGETVIRSVRIEPEGDLPAGGLNWATLRVPLDGLRAAGCGDRAATGARKATAEGEMSEDQILDVGRALMGASPLGFPTSRSDYDLARLAQVYASTFAAGERPVRGRVAALTGLTPKEVGARVYAARDKNLLTPTQQGRAGGQLTQRAKDLLLRLGGTSAEPPA